MNRREFLQHILALGAAASLPIDLACATEAEVAKAFAVLEEDPVVFESWGGTLNALGATMPEFREEVFDVSPERMASLEDVISEAEDCPPLASFLGKLYGDAEDGNLDDEWADWVRTTDQYSLEDFKEKIGAWLEEEIDWTWEDDYVRLSDTPTGRTYFFFEELDDSVLKELGVKLVDGDRPGSNYFAAELRKPVEDANEAAARLGLPIRFQAMG